MAERLINTFSRLAVLSGTVTSVSTTLNVSVPAPASLTSEGGTFRIVIDTEIMLVTAGATGTTWTVTRGLEGTLAAEHTNGANINHDLTAGILDTRYEHVGGSQHIVASSESEVKAKAEAVFAKGTVYDYAIVSATGELEDIGSGKVS